MTKLEALEWASQQASNARRNIKTKIDVLGRLGSPEGAEVIRMKEKLEKCDNLLKIFNELINEA